MSRSRDEERREYDSDVFYDVWRSGGNPDNINPDRVTDHFYDGWSAESAARCELNHQRPKKEYPEEQQWGQPEEQWPVEPSAGITEEPT